MTRKVGVDDADGKCRNERGKMVDRGRMKVGTRSKTGPVNGRFDNARVCVCAGNRVVTGATTKKKEKKEKKEKKGLAR